MNGPVRLFVFGLGYSAGAFARAFAPEAAWIGGTVRSADKGAALAGGGIEVVPWDGTRESTRVTEALHDATHLLVSIAPGESDPVLAHYRDAIRAAPNLKWIGYLSTVGVYGNYGGAWVGEATTPHPKSARSVERVAAERAMDKARR